MPMVTVQVTREGSVPGADRVTAEQKAEIYQGIAQLLLDVLRKPLDRTWVIFEEVELENWSQAGLPLPEYRKRQSVAD
ncbi:tautomerase family protein [Sphingomonas alba]|uniref:4-oxalocrotonate tautomerase family protein n=1 Tax=Sphingomonas alba TaxID=2908208 RepID=A0ABT0RPX6_9SPHN|nr:4-oxalocrotonate tautomerase family protein [Sphingomonas alba]MCL6684714.1 4-oxalocrotonate tautomerase family protein [Sphingomonas alba]